MKRQIALLLLLFPFSVLGYSQERHQSILPPAAPVGGNHTKPDGEKVEQNPPCDSQPASFFNAYNEHQPTSYDEAPDSEKPAHIKLYAAYLWATIIGVGIALVGLIFLICQTYSTKLAAEAASWNALAVIRAERPWLKVEVKSSGEGYWYFMCKNIGRTPARLISIHAEVVSVKLGESLPDIPVYGPPRVKELHPRMFPPNFERKIHDCYSNQFPTEDWKLAVQSGNIREFLIGKIVYSDELPTKDGNALTYHETRWGYALTAGGPPLISGWCPEGYDDYT